MAGVGKPGVFAIVVL